MKEFIDKLIERLEENIFVAELYGFGWEGQRVGNLICLGDVKDIAEELAEEYNNDFCKWEYDDFEDGWQTSCGTTFSLCDSDKEITHYCPCCGKKIKVVE